MSDDKEYIEPVVIERERDAVPESLEKPIDSGEKIDKADDSAINKHEVYDSDDPRKAIAEKHSRKQREELGIEDPAKAEEEPAKPEMVTVKVNGKEKQVLKSKVDEAGGLDVYQKRLAAEDRLQEVSLQKKELDAQKSKLQAEAENFRQWQQQQIQRLAAEKQSLAAAGVARPGQPPQGDIPDQKLKELAKQHREALYDGDDERADELLVQIQKLGARPQTPPVNVAEIEQRTFNRIQAKLAEEQAIRERKMAQQDFAKQYEDIVGDERLFQMADQETIRLRNQNPNWSDREVIMQAGANVRQWRDSVMGTASKAVASSDRTDAKRAMSMAKAASGRSPSKPQPKQQTPSEYVESLRAARGLGM